MQLIALCRLGRDAELKTTSNGKAVLNMALAYNYGQRQDGQQPTQWLDVAMFGDRAEKVAPYFTKGTAIVAYINDVHVHTYQKKDGTQGVTLRGTLQSFEFAGGKSERSEPKPEAPKSPMQAIQDMDPDLPF